MRLILLLLSVCFSVSALAHKASDSFIYVHADQIRLDIALQDIQRLHNVDLNRDQSLSWGELQASASPLRALLRSNISLTQDDADCPLLFRLDGLSQHSDGAYAVWMLDSPCLHKNGPLQLSYTLLFELDPLHRALLAANVGSAGNLLPMASDAPDDHVQLSVLSPAHNSAVLGEVNALDTALKFGWEGVVHLLIGYDHLMFLLALLLPATRRHGQSTLRGAFTDVAWVVTMFTLAHSLTLVCASLGWLSLPSKPVEIGIALSISLAAALLLLDVNSRIQRRLAMAVGLLHGLGFAGVLAGMLSTSPMKLVALGSFNLGIEFAQLVLVLLVLPLLYSLAASRIYQRYLLPFAALGLALSGLFMAWQRL